MTDRRGVRIATVGFQGFGNLGDEAILTGLERILSTTNAKVTTVFSGPDRVGVAAFPAARRIATRRHLPTLTALRALRSVDLLVLAGGGIFNDHWAAVIPRYAAWVLAGRVAGVRVAWAGVGVGPIRRRPLLTLTRLAAAMSQVVLVRDEQSAKTLASDRVRVVPDPSIFNDRPRGEPTGELGLIVRAPTRALGGHTDALIGALVDAAMEARARGLRPVILTMAGDRDRAVVERFSRALQARAGHDVHCEPIGATPPEALTRLACLSGVITVRLHGLLLAALAGVPSVPIAYDGKVRATAERLGLGDIVVPLAEVSDIHLLERLDMASTEGRRRTVEQRVRRMRDERSAFAEMLVSEGAQ